MNIIKTYLKALIVPLASLLILPIIFAIINLLGAKTNHILVLIMIIITSLGSGILLGKNINNKGYLKGLILGIIISLIYFIFGLIFNSKIQLNTLFYYGVIITSSTIGSMLGINKNKD